MIAYERSKKGICMRFVPVGGPTIQKKNGFLSHRQQVGGFLEHRFE